MRKFQDFLFFLDFPFWQIPLFSPMMDGTGRSDTAGKIEESQELFLIVDVVYGMVFSRWTAQDKDCTFQNVCVFLV